jgi:hypothetical protein
MCITEDPTGSVPATTSGDPDENRENRNAPFELAPTRNKPCLDHRESLIYEFATHRVCVEL